AYLVLAAIDLVCVIYVATQLPRERHFVRAAGLARTVVLMVRHFRDRRLVATFAVGFGALFTFVTIFTFINFHLADAPYDFTAAELGSLFIVYLFGVATTPLTGRLVARFGRRWLVLGAVGAWAIGTGLTAVPHLAVILLGLVIAACSGFICQAVSTGYVAYAATEARSSAVGLYVTAYYLGGSAGAVIGGFAWHDAGWLGCVAIVWLMLAVMAALIFRFWHEPPLQPAPT
ncbi:MAG: MFS transporter, partial [Stellaceae bacterium]